MDEYKAFLEDLTIYFANSYGLYLDVSEAEFKTIEINKTKIMDYQFKDYVPIFSAITPYMNRKKYKIHWEASTMDLDTETVYWINSSKDDVRKLKIYNKSKQINDSFKIQTIDNKYMRIEYTLTNDKIKDSFSTVRVFEMTQDMLNKFFNENIKEDLQDSFDKALDASNKHLKKLYKEHTANKKRGYYREFLIQSKLTTANNKTIALLDKSQIENISKSELSKKCNMHNKYKKMIIEELKSYNYLKLFREVIDKFSM